MNWYLIHTKPRQEECARRNLEQQGYACYLPYLSVEKVKQGAIATVSEPLFPRYLFIRLESGESAKSWSPIRSTKGVHRLVTFGTTPAKVDERLIHVLQAQENNANAVPQPLFSPGERVIITEGAFSGIEGIFQMADGEKRVMVLIELLNKPVCMPLAPSTLRKVC